MKLPYLSAQENKTKRSIINFRGLNYGAGAIDGDMSETLNISTALYPVLSQRGSRDTVKTLTAPTALFSRGKLAYVDGTGFYYDGVLKGTVIESKKQMATVGAKIIIFPDKKYYDTSADEFSNLENTYESAAGAITFTASTIATTGDAFAGFNEGDAVTITGCTTYAENNKTAIIREIASTTLTFYDGTFTAGVEAGAVTIKRVVPDMDFICENNNRLWGCGDGQIFASKLGDPTNFNVFDGLASDSYAVTVGTDGEFTGCIGYSTHIAFFKEDCVHRLYGTKPSNYSLVMGRIQGVQAGCEKSMVIINETLFYKAVNGIMSYTGSIPDLVSEAFGLKRFSDAVAGTDGERYYISMKCDDVWGLYAYDVLRGLWVREDGAHVTEFASLGGSLYCINADDKKLYKMNSGSERISWSAELSEMSENVTEKKGYSRLSVRMELDEGAYVQISINADNMGWKTIHTEKSQYKRMLSIPIIPTRCDTFKIRISGEGGCKIYGLVREVQLRSEA